MIKKPKLLIICGPTASGKSKFAMELAKKITGEIVNIDAIQVYKELPILTCSPTIEDKYYTPHHLYNHISITDNYSAGIYLDESIQIIKDITARNSIPIVVGGTGLYIKALCEGLSDIPSIPDEIRQIVRELFEKIGKEEFYRKLSLLDNEAAIKLEPSNSQRLMRAYEVFLYTGKSIYEYYKSDIKSPIHGYDVKTLILIPDRNELYARCDQRFIELMKIGAIEEVKSMGGIDISKIKAIGFAEITQYLDGVISKQEAIKLAQTKTRQYAKRQITWFKHQISGDKKFITDPLNREYKIW